MFSLTYLTKHWKLISVAVALTAIGSLIGFVYTMTHLKSGCPELTTCKYELFSEEQNNETFYGYYFVFNEEYRCKQWCGDKLDYMSCPANNTGCQIDNFIKNECSIFHCYNKANFAFSIICLLIFITAVVVEAATFIHIWICWSRELQPERIPLYAP